MPVSIYTDESVPVAVAIGLHRRDVTAVSARDVGNLSLSDPNQLTSAAINEMALFTHDRDFLSIADQWIEVGKTHWGIIYVHQNKWSIGECIHRLKEIADLFDSSDFRNYIEFL